MILSGTPVAGAFIVEPERHKDPRGFFARTIDAAVFRQAGLASSFPEHSIAYNIAAGTVRGLHYQDGTHAECKVVRCTMGAIFDVVVDLRAGSPTFKRWYALTLDSKNRTALYVPAGCAHGYQTISDNVEVLYAISAPYDSGAARGVHYADPELSIAWPLPVSVISERDAQLPRLANAVLPRL